MTKLRVFISWSRILSPSLKFIFFTSKHCGLFPHRMDARDRHNGQRDNRTNERTDGRTDGQTDVWTKRRVASLRPSVRFLDGVWHIGFHSNIGLSVEKHCRELQQVPDVAPPTTHRHAYRTWYESSTTQFRGCLMMIRTIPRGMIRIIIIIIHSRKTLVTLLTDVWQRRVEPIWLNCIATFPYHQLSTETFQIPVHVLAHNRNLVSVTARSGVDNASIINYEFRCYYGHHNPRL